MILMKVERLELTNFQQYKNETIYFDEGVSIIHGDNGAGKTSILRGIFGGLFQSSLTTEAPVSISLDNLVRNDEEYAEVNLSFTVETTTYEITWELERYEADSVRTKSCILTDTSNTIEVNGVTDVSDFIEKLLGIDASSFVNSVYVQQTDLSRLITASPKERKEIFDQLLGLEDVDRYIERAKKARRAVKRERKDAVSKRQEVRSQLEEYNEKNKLQKNLENVQRDLENTKERKSETEEKVSELEDKINELEKHKSQKSVEELERQLKNLQENLNDIDESIENKIEDKREIDTEVENVKTSIETAKSNLSFSTSFEQSPIHDEINTQINSLKSNISTLSARISSIDEEIRTIRNEVGSQFNDLHEKQNRLRETTKTRHVLEMNQESINDDIENTTLETFKVDEIENLSDLAFDYRNQYEKLREKSSAEHIRDIAIDELVKLNNKSSQIEIEMIALFELSTAELSTNGSTVSNAERQIIEYENRSYETAIQRNSNISREIENVEQREIHLKNQKNSIIKDIKNNESKLAEKKSELEELQTKIMSECNRLYRHITANHIVSEEVQHEKKIDKLEQELETLQNRRETQQEKIGMKNEEKIRIKQQLRDVKTKLENVSKDKMDQIERLETKKSKFASQKENVSDKIISLNQEERDIKNDLERVNSLTQRESGLNSTIEELTTTESEMNTLIDVYEDVKTEARTDSIKLINKYTNQIFTELYENSTYVRIVIEEDYKIQLQNSDGSSITPKMASGGEGAIINIALRAGVYRAIVDLNGKTQLPPVILDEPTTFLDETHVNKLTKLINKLNEWDVPQVIIVSHNQSLIDKADTIHTVTKDLTTGESNVTTRNV